MIGEVIAIGDELLSGQRLDTNSQWLSKELECAGVSVAYHSGVGDQLESMVQVLTMAVGRAEIVVVTGGLGPTADDLTRAALAQLAGQPLELRAEIRDRIAELFRRRGRRMPESNVAQAMFPRGATVIPNPHGTAPGLELTCRRPGTSAEVRIYALPGVPAEMQEMWQQHVLPAVQGATDDDAPKAPSRTVRHRVIRCFGAGESRIEQMLPDLIRRGRQPQVGITASGATISLRVTATGRDGEECDRAIEPVAATIYECLGSLIFGEGDDQLQHVVLRQLAARSQTLSVVEWATAGRVITRLRTAADEPSVIAGGLVFGAAAPWHAWAAAAGGPQASNLVGQVTDRRCTESGPVAEWLTDAAAWVQARFATDYALAVGPMPPPAQWDTTEGKVEMLFAGPDGTRPLRTGTASHPAIRFERLTKVALNLVRLELERCPPQ